MDVRFKLVLQSVICLLFLFLSKTNAVAGTITQTQAKVEPPPIGNFALPASQRPGASYSFGSRILGKGVVQVRTTPNVFKDTTARYIGMPSTLQLGTSKHTSLLLTLPATVDVARRTSMGIKHDSGLGNIGLQGEYEFYDRSSYIDTENMGLLLGFTVPSGAKAVSTASPSYFVGSTYTHSWVDWTWFAASGYLMFDGKRAVRPENKLYYEVGLGRNLYGQSGETILNGYLEINGQTDQKKPGLDRGALFSQGYLLFFSPSLFYSTKSWIVELGFSAPITQRWAHSSDKVEYYASLSVFYTLPS